MTADRRGFTLIELLVVMAIIGILAALAFPAAAVFQRMAYSTRSRALLTQVASALDRYQAERSVLPTCAPGFTTPGLWTWVETNNAMLVTELVSTDPVTTQDGRTYDRPGYLAGALPTWALSGARIRDAWGRPIIYFARNAAGAWVGPTTAVKPFAGNAFSCELWSAGPDHRFADLRVAPTGQDDDRDNIPARSYDPSVTK